MFGNTAFGAGAAPQTGGFSFGGTPASSTGFSFGTPAATTSAAPGVGFSLTPASSAGLTFGTPASSTGLTFGIPASSTGLTFGTPASSTGLTFGAPASSTGLTFGAPASSTGLTFGAPTSSTGLTFGAPSSSSGLTFGTAAPSAPATGFSFGTPATSSAPTFAAGFGGFGATTAASSGGGFGAAAASTAAAPAAGLGGSFQLGATGSAAGGSGPTVVNKTDGKPVKETMVPNEVVQTVEAVKKHIKEQKSECEVVSRHSWSAVQRASEETDSLARLLAAVEASVQQHASVAAKLKLEVCQALKNAEVAQRTSEISTGLQYENTAPQEFFQRQVVLYQQSMETYRRQIDRMERLLAAPDGAAPVSPEELMLAFRRLHETFVWLAGQLQTIHERVQALKDHYLLYRRKVVGDTSDVFSGRQQQSGPDRPSRPALPVHQPGPSPFAVDRNQASRAMAQALGQARPQPLPVQQAPSLFGGQTPAAPAAFGGASLLGAAPAAGGTPLNLSTGSAFKLDPPPGSKRGKTD